MGVILWRTVCDTMVKQADLGVVVYQVNALGLEVVVDNVELGIDAVDGLGDFG